MGCSDPPLTGVGAPHQCPLGKFSMLLSLYTDVRSILMVLLTFQRQASPALQKANGNDGEFRKLFKHYDASALAYEALEMHKEAFDRYDILDRVCDLYFEQNAHESITMVDDDKRWLVGFRDTVITDHCYY